MIGKEEIGDLNKKFENATAQEILLFFSEKYNGRIVFASSMGAEDQVLHDMICSIDKSIRVFTLDTGRLFNETYELIEKTKRKYNLNVEIYFPDKEKVENMVNEFGINLFFDSVENRKLCCSVRKTDSLNRALKGAEAWICGLRRNQSVTRISVDPVEWDEENGIVKINPLFNWTENDVWEYIDKNNVPYNVLHKKSYPSIGCQPCTSPVMEGDDIRSGRWWWENAENRECGLHNNPKRKNQ